MKPPPGVLPTNHEAEMSCIGAMLMQGDITAKRNILSRAFEIARPEDYHRAANRLIVQAIFDMFWREEPVDAITVHSELIRMGYDEQAYPGPAYLISCVETCPSSENIEAYVSEVKRLSAARELIAGLEQINYQARNGTGPEIALKTLSDLHEHLQYRIKSAKPITYSTDADLDAIVANVRWLWPGHIPFGFLSAIAGETGTGKSFIALDFCKRVLTGNPWPDGVSMPPYRMEPKILWIEAESRHAVLRQRLDAMEIPRGKFILPANPLRDLRVDNENDWNWVKEAVAFHHPPLVVLDSLTGAHSSAENKAEEQKVICRQLAELAAKEGCAILVTHHLSKPAAGIPEWPVSLHRLRGSSVIAQYCLSIFAIGTPNRSELDDRAFVSIKNNLAPDPPPLGYWLTETGPAWSRNAPTAARPKTAVQKAEEFLREILKTGPVLSNHVQSKAAATGITPASIRRAATALGVNRSNKDKSGHNLMMLPESHPTEPQEL